MPATYPYVIVPNHIGTLLDKIVTVNKPTKVTSTWLTQLGLTSTNDRALIPLFRAMGYIDGGGAPTDKWAELKGSEADRKASVGRALKRAYPDVFGHFPDDYVARTLTKDELQNHVRPNVTAGAAAVRNIVATFFALRDRASFEAAGSVPSGTAVPSPATSSGAPLPTTGAPAESSATAVNVTITLALELPATSDSDVYDKLFEAMAKHLGKLLGRGS